jgi:hypothetical protein
MKLQTINSSHLTWTIHPSQYSDVSEVYCADGDGLVSVNKRLSGVYYVTCDFFTCDFFGELQGIYANLEEALAKGEELLHEYYPEVYEEAMFWDKEAQS